MFGKRRVSDRYRYAEAAVLAEERTSRQASDAALAKSAPSVEDHIDKALRKTDRHEPLRKPFYKRRWVIGSVSVLAISLLAGGFLIARTMPQMKTSLKKETPANPAKPKAEKAAPEEKKK